MTGWTGQFAAACITTVIATCAWAQEGAWPPDEKTGRKTKVIRVDCSAARGKMEIALGVNKGPLAGKGKDITEDLRRLGVTDIRTHDFDGPTDWYVMFPDWDADPDDPASYNFSKPAFGRPPSDDVVARIVKSGFQPYFRLGISWNTHPDNTDKWRKPPADPAKWAKICRRIVMHYNEGWADGFRHGIKRWEIWNEPDIPRFWHGTPEEFFALYEQTARALKSHDPKLEVGACGFASVHNKKFFDPFVEHCREKGVPLDFLSWHWYGNIGGKHCPSSKVAACAKLVRETLDAAGFRDTESHCTEWNVSLPESEFYDQPLGAAYIACQFRHFLDHGVSRVHFYPGYGHWGLFKWDGGWRKQTYGYLAYARLQGETPVRLAAEVAGDEKEYGVVAGKSADGGVVQVLIGSQYSDCDKFRLVVGNLPEGKTFSVEHFAVDAANDLAKVHAETQSTKAGKRYIVLERPLAPPAVALVKFAAESK